MSNEQIMEIVRESTHEVLDKYLTGKLLFEIEREIARENTYEVLDKYLTGKMLVVVVRERETEKEWELKWELNNQDEEEEE